MATPVTCRGIVGFIALMLLTSLLGACATIRTGSHFDETTDFGAYQSFSWIDDTPYISAENAFPVSALALSMVKSEIQAQLELKGYAYTDVRDNADFVVAFTVGTREEIRIDSYPADYRGRWGWHVPYSHYYYREISAHTYNKGTLGVDIFDNESGKPVWHGWAENTVTESDRDDPGPAIEEGIGKLFEAFPR